MKKREIKAESVQIGDRLVRENILGEEYALLITEVDHGDYMSIHYITESGSEFITHYFSDETISIVDETK